METPRYVILCQVHGWVDTFASYHAEEAASERADAHRFNMHDPAWDGEILIAKVQE